MPQQETIIKERRVATWHSDKSAVLLLGSENILRKKGKLGKSNNEKETSKQERPKLKKEN